jgi:hypothetical protein
VKVGDESKWAELIKGSTGVVNLAGPPISTRWTPEVRKVWNSCSIFILFEIRFFCWRIFLEVELGVEV